MAATPATRCTRASTGRQRTTGRLLMALTQWTNSMEWLAAASEDPGACKQEWQNGSTGVALLEAGRFWDVLIVPEQLGLRVADLLEELPLLEPGPCLLDARRRHVGFLLPPEPQTVWIGTGCGCWAPGPGSPLPPRTAAGGPCAGSSHRTAPAPSTCRKCWRWLCNAARASSPASKGTARPPPMAIRLRPRGRSRIRSWCVSARRGTRAAVTGPRFGAAVRVLQVPPLSPRPIKVGQWPRVPDSAGRWRSPVSPAGP